MKVTEDTSSTDVRLTDTESEKDALLRALKEGALQGSDRVAVFTGKDLSDLDLSGCNLEGVNLSHCDLSGSKFVRANLSGAVLTNTRLDKTEFLGANLQGADLSQAKGERTGFAGANARDLRALGTELAHASFAQADLTHADFRGAVLERVHLREAKLDHADFTNARLENADMESACVDHASFEGANIQDARLRSVSGFETARWVRADIRNVDFCGAYMLRRHIQDENYLYEFRSRSKKHEWLYRVWWLTSDCGRSLLRWGVLIGFIITLFGFLYMAVDVDYGDYTTPISPFYYSVVTLTTLGYGDVLPMSMAAQILATTQAMLGYIALGGLLSILANKMARRAE